MTTTVHGTDRTARPAVAARDTAAIGLLRIAVTITSERGGSAIGLTNAERISGIGWVTHTVDVAMVDYLTILLTLI